ncbi:methyltransferase [Micromonospora echinaurantiaca]|uniref:methyltransferase n=1 Tax=Micromonospora echinaurantiaca TaxID=47857 RepID=UPI0037A6EEFC
MTLRRGDISSMLEVLPPFAIRVAATLRLSDHLGDGPRSAGELALATGADADALGRLLRYLCSLGLYREDAPDRFALTPAGRMLTGRSTGDLRQWLDLDGAGGRMDLALAGLLHAVRTGGPGYPAVFDRPFWDDLAADPARAASFDELMAAKSARVVPDLAALNWAGVRHVVDVGGGVGRTLGALLRAHPHLRGTLLDRPPVAEQARRQLAEAGLAGRCAVVGGSFLTEVPGGGDAYLLFDILHNWDDETAREILGRCAAAAGPAGRVLVVEEVPADDDRNGRAMDLKMLVLFGGRQRTEAGFAALAAKAGLGAPTVRRLPCGFSVVETAGTTSRGDG